MEFENAGKTTSDPATAGPALPVAKVDTTSAKVKSEPEKGSRGRSGFVVRAATTGRVEVSYNPKVIEERTVTLKVNSNRRKTMYGSTE